MPVDKITSAQFEDLLRQAIIDRNNQIDTAVGPVYDAAIRPQSVVFEAQNDRIRYVASLLALENLPELTDADDDIEAIVRNEGIIRSEGSAATVTLVFSRATRPTVDVPVPRGFPVATPPSQSDGSTVMYVVTETRTMLAAAASSYLNLRTQRYELSVPATATTGGTEARVGPNRVNRPMRPLVGFDSVTNPDAAVGGLARETNQELVDRYLLAIVGRQAGTPKGIERIALTDFANVESVYLVYGDDPFLTRATDSAGAVDLWVKGDAVLQTTENVAFLGIAQIHPVSTPPLVTVVSVSSGGTTYVEGTDYEVVYDDSGFSGSTRATDGVVFLPGGSAPAVGAVVTIVYSYNSLIREMQVGFQDPDVLALGSDLLIRQGVQVPIAVSARIRVLAGFSPTSVIAAAQVALVAYIDGLGMGAPVEASDLQAVVRAISGVDNFIIDRLTPTDIPAGTDDVQIDPNQYATLSTANLTLTSI